MAKRGGKPHSLPVTSPVTDSPGIKIPGYLKSASTKRSVPNFYGPLPVSAKQTGDHTKLPFYFSVFKTQDEVSVKASAPSFQHSCTRN